MDSRLFHGRSRPTEESWWEYGLFMPDPNNELFIGDDWYKLFSPIISELTDTLREHKSPILHAALVMGGYSLEKCLTPCIWCASIEDSTGRFPLTWFYPMNLV